MWKGIEGLSVWKGVEGLSVWKGVEGLSVWKGMERGRKVECCVEGLNLCGRGWKG